MPHSNGRRGEGLGRSEQILAEELPALAREVTRVETVRVYAEMALKLDSLIGDVEDAVSYSVISKLRAPTNSLASEETRLATINSLKQIKDTLTHVTFSAVDHHFGRALAVLRPQAIVDHRSLISSVYWYKPSNITNPLFPMGGELKTKYCENFLSLCHLQELQSRRKAWQLEGHNLVLNAIHQLLWVIEELVSPIFLAA